MSIGTPRLAAYRRHTAYGQAEETLSGKLKCAAAGYQRSEIIIRHGMGAGLCSRPEMLTNMSLYVAAENNLIAGLLRGRLKWETRAARFLEVFRPSHDYFI